MVTGLHTHTHTFYFIDTLTQLEAPLGFRKKVKKSPKWMDKFAVSKFNTIQSRDARSHASGIKPPSHELRWTVGEGRIFEGKLFGEGWIKEDKNSCKPGNGCPFPAFVCRLVSIMNRKMRKKDLQSAKNGEQNNSYNKTVSRADEKDIKFSLYQSRPARVCVCVMGRGWCTFRMASSSSSGGKASPNASSR